MKNLLSIVLLMIFIAICQLALAQDRKGNIVEYFGKEKVEDIREGKVLHVFKEGLVLPGSRFSNFSTTVRTNPLFSRILQEGKYYIFEGKQEQLNPLGDPAVWKSAKVNEKNEFQGRGIRGGGYVYLEHNADAAKTVLFEVSGPTDVLLNGYPHEGDHYDYGWNLLPIKLKKGKNEFLLRGGRFPRVRARLLEPGNPVQFTTRDMTLPDLIVEENKPLYAAVRIINASSDWLNGSVVCRINEAEQKSEIPAISPMHVRKIGFKIPSGKGNSEGSKVEALLTLKNPKGKVISTETIQLDVKSKHKHHKRTFKSEIDGSVQYYSVAPSSNPDIENPAMFLSVHGASVEAVNQARAYKQKDWGHLVAPTNRRPFGYAWENWGRIDALEVLNHAEKLFGTDPQHTYLTGHSMGGHGTWQLGVTYPDRWAAIAPCAGYPDLEGYSRRFMSMLQNLTDEQAKRYGINKDQMLRAARLAEKKNEAYSTLDSLIRRSGNPGRTLKLKRNYLHHGIFILHGEKDNVVPTEQARRMRETLGKFHPDFTYYEYPDGTHWYGDHSVDWSPIFDFFKARSLKESSSMKKFEFYTASPGVSPKSHFLGIHQQIVPLEISSVDFNREKESVLTTNNVGFLCIDIQKMGAKPDTITIDKQNFVFTGKEGKVFLKNINESWHIAEKPGAEQKGPHRNGGFKDAFNNNVVLVYATNGTRSENEWYYNRALYDAEKFYYLGNGSIEIIKDSNFKSSKYKDRNVVLYGNRDNNKAWKNLLKHCPVQVSDNKIQIGDKKLAGEQWGTVFIYPRSDSDKASVGVVSATGEQGMRATFSNDYLGRPAYPDVLIFDHTMMKNGISGVKCTGFFGNDWSVDNGDFEWKSE